jgi:thiamine kinase-like enzyme
LETNLKGNSGCKIEIVGDIVRKTSRDLHYNKRLEEQMKKQLRFKQDDYKNFLVPDVIQQGFTKKLFYYDMEYISGIGYQDFTYKSSKKQIDQFIIKINDFIDSNSKKLFEPKYADRLKHVNKINQLIVNSKFKSHLEKLKNLIEEGCLDDLPITACHGDLTIQNIIFSGNDHFLIDFLDVYIDSYYWDLAKLKQSFFYNWNKEYIKKPDLHRIEQVFSYIWKGILNQNEGALQDDAFQYVDLLSLLRLEPYLTTKNELVYFEHIINERILELKI